MREEKLQRLLNNMEQIERFFCENCGNDSCTLEQQNECTIAFAILAKNTSWGFVLEDLVSELTDHVDSPLVKR
jgi:hypothetical protein